MTRGTLEGGVDEISGEPVAHLLKGGVEQLKTSTNAGSAGCGPV